MNIQETNILIDILITNITDSFDNDSVYKKLEMFLHCFDNVTINKINGFIVYINNKDIGIPIIGSDGVRFYDLSNKNHNDLRDIIKPNIYNESQYLKLKKLAFDLINI